MKPTDPLNPLDPLDVVDSIQHAGSWVVDNQGLLIQYAVNLVAAFLIFIFGWLVARIVSNTISKLMLKKGVDRAVSHFVRSLVRYAIIIFTLMAALGRLGVETSSVIAVIGAAGLAVGLALQGSLSNFAAGVLIVGFRPFRAGDFVDLGGVSGTVESVQIFSTILCTVDKKTVIIPNATIMNGKIINFSLEENRRVDLLISVGYEADIDQVKEVLASVVNADDRILADLGCTIRMMTMGASSLDFVVRPWVKNADYWNVYFDLMENIKKALDANNINIPYPQMDVHVRQQNKIGE
ncbi:MAG: small-conductance mechanosensitive channel MscS [Plesiomonas sp.]|uniref:small-conductance mechanosensitive channel MscS n=1 Tax=Plesiomonas sp. TaxID=2486279 RepID=UPI003F386347